MSGASSTFLRMVAAAIATAAIFGAASSVHAAALSRPAPIFGLVGWWTFDEGSGDTAYDRSGNDHDGTLTSMNTATDWVAGKKGGALDFDGINDHVTKNVQIVSEYPFTLSAWVKTSETGVIFGLGDKDDIVGYYYIHVNTNGTAGMTYRSDIGSGNTGIAGTTDIFGDWHHVVGVYASDTDKRLYVDGVLEATSTNVAKGFSANVDRFTIGRNPRDGSAVGQFTGMIDDVRIYDRELSESEIQALFGASSNRITRRVVSNEGLIGWWGLDEGTGTIARDQSGQEHHGLIVDAPARIPGVVGNALSFDGVSRHVSLGTSSDFILDDSKGFTISLWAKPNANGNPPESLFIRGGSVTSAVYMDWGITAPSFATSWRAHVSDGTTTLMATTGNGSYEVGVWQHLVGVYSSSDKTIRLYKNGVEVASTTNSSFGGYVPSGRPGVAIGGEHYGADGEIARYFFNGAMDDVRLYNRVLSPAEIQTLYLYKPSQATIGSSQQGHVSDGLVGYWSFNGQDIDWGTNTIFDRSGNGYHGSTTSLTTSSPVPGKAGQALEFNGSNQSIQLPASLPSEVYDFTVTAWVKLDPQINRHNALIAKSPTTSNFRFLLHPDNHGNYLGVVESSGGGVGTGTGLPADQWVFVTIKRSGSTAYFFKNAQQNTSWNASTSSISFSSAKIGQDGASYALDGQVDELRIYDRALSDSEITQLYNLGR